MGRLNKAVPFRHGCGSWAGCPSYNLSVTFGDSSPLEGRLRGGPNTEICVTCGGTEAMMAAVPGSSFFKEPVNHLIRMHFARGTDVLDEAVHRLAKLTELLKYSSLRF